MKQNLVLALFAFAVAVASSTWFVTAVMPPRARDSAPPATVAATPTAPRASVPAPNARPVSDTTRRDSLPVLPPKGAPGDTVAEAARAKAVAKIMASMKPKDAAAIVANLNDDELERIIRQLNAKQVASLLTALPKDRAATMSRRLLAPGAAGKGIGT